MLDSVMLQNIITYYTKCTLCARKYMYTHILVPYVRTCTYIISYEFVFFITYFSCSQVFQTVVPIFPFRFALCLRLFHDDIAIYKSVTMSNFLANFMQHAGIHCTLIAASFFVSLAYFARLHMQTFGR